MGSLILSCCASMKKTLDAPLMWEAPARPNRATTDVNTDGKQFPNVYGVF